MALVCGPILLFVPVWWGDLVAWPGRDVAVYRLVGAAFLGCATSSILVYRQTFWEKVILFVRTEIVWTGLATLVLLWSVIWRSGYRLAGGRAHGWLLRGL